MFVSPPRFVCGSGFICCIDSSGFIYTVGKTDKGQCGKLSINKIIDPYQIESLVNITSIGCGNNHTICCDINGDVWTFGSNSYGQLGQDMSTMKQTNIPQKVNIPFTTMVSCGHYFNICISDIGNIWSFGDNSYGQLGIGNKDESKISSPQKVIKINNADYIDCGSFNALCYTKDHEFYTWGNNSSGQLAHGCTDAFLFPKKCDKLPNNVISIKLSGNHSLFLTQEGDVYSCGNNMFGRLGLSKDTNLTITLPQKLENLPEIKRIEVGILHSMCIDIENNLWLFGCNVYGELGFGNYENGYFPKKQTKITDIIDISHKGICTYVKTNNNEIYAFGSGFSSYPKKVFIGKEDIWSTNFGKSRAKSARK